MIEPTWFVEFRCGRCKEELTARQVQYRRRCPYCGTWRMGSLENGVDAGRLVIDGLPHTEHRYRVARRHPRWMFWKKPERVYWSPTTRALL